MQDGWVDSKKKCNNPKNEYKILEALIEKEIEH
jgi:hypothetical protein